MVIRGQEEGWPCVGRYGCAIQGLEAAIVVLWGIDGIKIEDYRELLYVGLSRSKSRLYLAGQQTSCSQVMRFKDSVAATS